MPLTHEKDVGHAIGVNSWLRKGVALVVVLTATFITIHPDFDLLDGVLHSGHDRASHVPVVIATLARADEMLLLIVHSLLEAHSQRETGGVVSLDLLCVRLC